MRCQSKSTTTTLKPMSSWGQTAKEPSPVFFELPESITKSSGSKLNGKAPADSGGKNTVGENAMSTPSVVTSKESVLDSGDTVRKAVVEEKADTGRRKRGRPRKTAVTAAASGSETAAASIATATETMSDAKAVAKKPKMESGDGPTLFGGKLDADALGMNGETVAVKQNEAVKERGCVGKKVMSDGNSVGTTLKPSADEQNANLTADDEGEPASDARVMVKAKVTRKCGARGKGDATTTAENFAIQVKKNPNKDVSHPDVSRTAAKGSGRGFKRLGMTGIKVGRKPEVDECSMETNEMSKAMMAVVTENLKVSKEMRDAVMWMAATNGYPEVSEVSADENRPQSSTAQQANAERIVGQKDAPHEVSKRKLSGMIVDNLRVSAGGLSSQRPVSEKKMRPVKVEVTEDDVKLVLLKKLTAFDGVRETRSVTSTMSASEAAAVAIQNAERKRRERVNQLVAELKLGKLKQVKKEEATMAAMENGDVGNKDTGKRAIIDDEVQEPVAKQKKPRTERKKSAEVVPPNAAVLDAAEGSNKMLGAHVSAAGGVDKSIANAVSLGCRSMALFVCNQRTWKCPPMDDLVVERFETAAKKYAFPLDQIVVHSSYLVNLGSPDAEKLKQSRDRVLDECLRCERVGIKLYNFHPGSAVGKCTSDECIRVIAESMNYIIERTKFIILVLETMAGQGSVVGKSFEQIRDIIHLVDDRSRVGVCIDTCHIFAAGYDIRTKEGYEKTMSDFDNIVGFKYLRAVHLNDSKGDLGSNLDRHENIGKGKLKIGAFRLLMEDPRFDRIPMVLETPGDDYPSELIRLYNSTKGSAQDG